MLKEEEPASRAQLEARNMMEGKQGKQGGWSGWVKHLYSSAWDTYSIAAEALLTDSSHKSYTGTRQPSERWRNIIN